MEKNNTYTEELSDSIDSSDIIDELESVASSETEEKLEPDECERGEKVDFESVNNLVELLDLTLVIWLREMYSKYKLPYLMSLYYLEISDYLTNEAEELINKEVNPEPKLCNDLENN
ncbi:hypothetical protein FG379_002908 [Cryptosporidium bovis]|uniref:uncharacterized protein n=1 Tax=Cryptosporidium bovis TaxID=310047 RepID=UPI00351A5D84|nr:hypothetical protein FG379_002908 [Cryptosporidium bovis]